MAAIVWFSIFAIIRMEFQVSGQSLLPHDHATESEYLPADYKREGKPIHCSILGEIS